MKKKKKFCSLFVFLLVVLLFLSSFAFFMSRNNDDYSENGGVDVVDFSSLNMVAIGDSILAGQGIELPMTVSLKNLLGLKSCLNYGIPGSTLANVSGYNPFVTRYDRMLSNADIVFVECAGNDVGKIEIGTIDDTTDTTFYGALKIMCKGLKEKYPNAFIFFQPSFYREQSFCDRAKPFMNALKEVSTSYGFYYFDVFYEDFEFNYKTDTIDWVHLSQEYTTNVWTPAIAQFIKDNYKK